MTHPFIQAVQAAYDTHGLPDGIASVKIGSIVGETKPFTAWAIADKPGQIGASASGITVDEAVAGALTRHMAAAVMKAERETARAVLAAAGLDPDMVAK